MSLKSRYAASSATLPFYVEIGISQAQGIAVDNYSNRWLAVGNEGLFVPPYTLGWANNMYGSSASSIQIQASAPSGVHPALTVVDGTVVVSVYDAPLSPNPGVPYLGLDPIRMAMTLNLTCGGSLILDTTVSLQGFGGLTGTSFYLEHVDLTYDGIGNGALAPAAPVQVRVTPQNLPTNIVHSMTIVPNSPNASVQLGKLEARYANVVGQVQIRRMSFGAGGTQEVILLAFFYVAT